MNQNTILHSFDNARFGKFHVILMVLAGLCWMLVAYGVTIIGFLSTSLREEWQVSASAIGWLASIGMLGMFMGAVIIGILSDKFGRRNMLALTLVFLGVAFITSSFAWNYPSLLVLRFLTGLGLGAILPVSSTLIAEFSPSKNRGAMSVTMNACWGVGGTFAALAGYSLVLNQGWRPALLIGGTALIISPLVRLLLPESMRFLLGKGKWKEAEGEFLRVHRQLTGESQAICLECYQPVDIVIGKNRGIWSRSFARITFALWVLWIALNFFYQGAFVWLPTLLTGTQFSEGRSFLLTILISLGQIPGTLIAAFLADRMSRRKLLFISLALLTAGSLLFGLSQKDAWVLILGFLLMVFNGMAWGMAYPFSSELFPTRMRGTATGWATGIGRLGGVAAPLMVSWVTLAGGSIFHVFLMFSCVLIITIFIVGGVKLETTGRSLEELYSGS